MSVTVHVVDSIVGLRKNRRTSVVRFDSQNVAELVAKHRPESWSADAPVLTIVSGRRVGMDHAARDGDHLIIAPEPREPFTTATTLGIVGNFLFKAALTFAIGYAIQKLISPSRDVVEQDDEASPTYAFGGAQTSYGPGFRIPFGYGEHDAPGHVAAQERIPLGSDTEVVRTLLIIGRGRGNSIGGLKGNVNGETGVLGSVTGASNPLLPFPENIRVNGRRLDQDTAQVAIRNGTQFQTPVPWFRADAPNLVDVLSELPAPVSSEPQDVTAQIPTADADEFKIRIQFPSGLYQNNAGTLSPFPVEFDVAFRERLTTGGVQAWVDLGTITVSLATAPQDGFSREFTFEISSAQPSEVEGFDVRVRRLTDEGTNTGSIATVDRAVWREIEYRVAGRFGYPNLQYIAIAQRATAALSGQRLNFAVRAEHRLVRVWDETVNGGNPSEQDYYDVPASGDAYHGIWSHPPGRNPGWIGPDYALDREDGLGSRFSEGNIDWPAWRNFADHCDRDWNTDEMRHPFDFRFDEGVEGWEGLMRICRIGRGIPVMVGNKLSVVYSYRDAHGRGTNSVPARARVAMVNTSNVADFSATRVDPRNAPTILWGQFQNAALEYERDAIPLEQRGGAFNDPTAFDNPPPESEAVDLGGITDGRQVLRELHFLHEVTRLTLWQCEWIAGPDQIGAELFDIVGVQHDAFRPHEGRDLWFSCRTAAQSASVRTITLDTDLTVTDGAHSVIVHTQPDPAAGLGTEYGWLIAEGNGTYPAGTPLATSNNQPVVQVRKGAPCSIGEYSGTTNGAGDSYAVLDCVIVGIERIADTPGLFRFTAVQWVPDAYDDLALSDTSYLSTTSGDLASDSLSDAEESLQPNGVGLTLLSTGEAELRIDRPAAAAGRLAQVFANVPGQPPELVGSTSGSTMRIRGLATDTETHFRVVFETGPGQIGLVEQADVYPLVPTAPSGSPVLGHVHAPADIEFAAVDHILGRFSLGIEGQPLPGEEIPCNALGRSLLNAANAAALRGLLALTSSRVPIEFPAQGTDGTTNQGNYGVMSGRLVDVGEMLLGSFIVPAFADLSEDATLTLQVATRSIAETWDLSLDIEWNALTLGQTTSPADGTIQIVDHAMPSSANQVEAVSVTIPADTFPAGTIAVAIKITRVSATADPASSDHPMVCTGSSVDWVTA